MLLGVIPMICFGILRIFGEKSQKGANWKSGHIVLLHQGVGCLAAVRPRCQNGTPCVRHNVAKLHRGVATVQSEKFFF